MSGDDKLTGTTIYSGSVSTDKNYAFDGSLDTYFATSETEWTWVGLDLGEQYVITKIGYAPRNNADYGPSRMVLGVFEGANSPDFMDAVPLRLIGSEPEANVITSVDIDVSRGFRYVRYVSPNGGKCNIAEFEVYGHAGGGDDTHFYQITALPTVSIHVADNVNPPNDGVDYTSNLFIAYENGTLTQEYPIQTRVRGNYSASWDNKPYRIKFDDGEKHHMLKDSPEQESPAKAKKWTLISSYGDKTLMRNPVSYEISKRVGLPFSPWCKPVDLILNGEYRGTYQLTDHVDIKKNRIDITEMTADDVEGEALTGGYLIEMNGYASSDPVHFTSSRSNPITVHSPEDDVIQQQQLDYIVDHFNDMETRVFSSDYTDPEKGYRAKLDLTTFLKYFLSNEFSSNTDYLWQVYMYKERGDEHIYTGPVWDNDLSLENDGNYYPGNDQSDWVYKVRSAGSWGSLVTRILSDGYAMSQLKSMWYQLRKNEVFTADNIAAYVDSLRDVMSASAALNFQRWPYLNQKVHCNPTVYGSWDAEVDNVRDYVYGRVGWMDSMLSLALKKQNDIYLIASAQDMFTFADMVNAGQTDIKVQLTADIDFADIEDKLPPIGSYEKPFKGQFDGKSHTISNLVMEGNENVGLFAALGDGAMITDLFLDSSCSFTGDNYVGSFAGAIVAPGAVTFEKTGTEAYVTARNDYAGGFAGGYQNGHSIAYITDSYNMSQVDAPTNADAFVGGGGDTRLTTSYNGGLVTGQAPYMVLDGDQIDITDDQIVSGEVCYRLNGGTRTKWRQNIDNSRTKDAFPVPRSNHGIVYDNEGKYTNINSNSKGYRYYMLQIDADKGAGVIQMSEFDVLDAADVELETLTAYNGNVDGFGSEDWQNLTDNNVETKFCAAFQQGMYVMFDAGEDFDAYGYRIYTANDTKEYPGRNIGSWKLYASENYTDDPESNEWILIDEVVDDDKLEGTNFTPYTYYIEHEANAADGYRYYLWQIAGSKGGSTIQMAEFALLDDEENEREALTIYAGTESSISNENWANLADHNVQTKFCSSNSNAPFSFFFDAKIRMKPMAYRIYTANDTERYSERNPLSWTLWGSNTMNSDANDGSWILLDEHLDDTVLEAANYTPYDFIINWPQEESGISTTKNVEIAERIYDIEGREMTELHRGLNLVRMKDGTVRKVLVR